MTKYKELPTPQVVIGYENIFKGAPPENRLEIISDISKSWLVCELSGLNYRLKPLTSVAPDTTRETQEDELFHMCGGNVTLTRHYENLVNEFILQTHRPIKGQHPKSPVIFNRPCCLIALQEIILSDEIREFDDFKATPHTWNQLMKYILLVNSEIVAYSNENYENEAAFIETFSIQTLLLNELFQESEPISPIERLSLFMDFLERDPRFAGQVEAYLSGIGISSDKYLFVLVQLVLKKRKQKSDIYFDHIYGFKDDDDAGRLIADHLSQRRLFTNRYPFELLEIKNGPFYKLEDRSLYCLLDGTYLGQQAYELFINNFWFQHLQPNKICGRGDFGSAFGNFFEQYCVGRLRIALAFHQHPPLKSLEELKSKIGKNEVELADFYFQQNKKILIGQIKSSGLRVAKYSGDVASFFDKGKEAFLKDFGLTQLVTSIEYLRDYGQLFDRKFPTGKQIEVFPVIVTNEICLTTGMMPCMFNIEFGKLINPDLFPLFTIHPVAVLHVSDVERLSHLLPKRQVVVWDLLKEGFKKVAWGPIPMVNLLNRYPTSRGFTYGFLEKIKPYLAEEGNNTEDYLEEE